MAIDITKTIQENLGYPPVAKIDPNTHTQQDKTVDETQEVNGFRQAAIPAVLTALYKLVQTDDGASMVLRGNSSTGWAGKLFNNNSLGEVFKDYASGNNSEQANEIDRIANEAIRVAKEQMGDNATTSDVQDFFSGQRNNILVYLPPSLQMGHLLNDEALDDNTNKMEGPVSGMMKSIASVFDNPTTLDDEKKGL